MLIDCDGVAPDGVTGATDLFSDQTGAPELLMHDAGARSRASDVWALGVLVASC